MRITNSSFYRHDYTLGGCFFVVVPFSLLGFAALFISFTFVVFLSRSPLFSSAIKWTIANRHENIKAYTNNHHADDYDGGEEVEEKNYRRSGKKNFLGVFRIDSTSERGFSPHIKASSRKFLGLCGLHTHTHIHANACVYSHDEWVCCAWETRYTEKGYGNEHETSAIRSIKYSMT